MKHVFISYSRKDSSLMQRIRAELEQKRIQTWTDEQLTPGTRAWKLAIQKAIEEAGAVVALLSPDAKESEWVDRELEYARLRNIQIYPLLARGEAMNAVPLELVNAQRIDIRDEDKYKAGIKQLILALDKHLGIRRKSLTERLEEQLKLIAQRIPNAYFAGVVSTDGLAIAYYFNGASEKFANDEHQGEIIVAAMNAAAFSWATRIMGEIDGDNYSVSMLRGSRGAFFQIVLGDEYVLTFGVRDLQSVDSTLVILQQWWGELLRLLEVEEPAL